MVLTKTELIASLQNEARILLHLAGKIEPTMVDYRPTPNQRSTIELLRYLVIMGPSLVASATAGAFDRDAWTTATAGAASLNVDQAISAIAAQPEAYASLLSGLSDDDFRAEITMFGSTSSVGAFIVGHVLCGCAAYRTQLFLYLKACGRAELSTMNLWVGMDAAAAV